MVGFLFGDGIMILTRLCKRSDAESSSHSPLVDRKACLPGAGRRNIRWQRIPGCRLLLGFVKNARKHTYIP